MASLSLGRFAVFGFTFLCQSGYAHPFRAKQQLDIMMPGVGSHATVTSVRFGSLADTQRPEKCDIAELEVKKRLLVSAFGHKQTFYEIAESRRRRL